MKLIEVKNREELGIKAASLISDLVRRKPDAVLGLATGGTPVETYRHLVEDHHANRTSYRKIRTVNLDEYVGLGTSDSNSYHAYMEAHLFRFIDLPAAQHHVPDGQALDLDRACRDYDQLIDRLGGIDLQLLGIGRNGHIGFNEPGSSFSIGTHIVRLTESTRAANARYFSRPEDVPERAITMGIGTILKSRQILLIVSGKNKAEAMKQFLKYSKPENDFPASALISHPDVTVIADEEALSLAGQERAGISK
ncbi:glucosamine-6-phosphate deaminase [Sporolactobacillus vineae]|uniref:glucosamine-6-phosphate deaminase n=1 Tax=Sporolactobacillus vineae TaxID=444463 RepID=UPI000288B367|nr:glucosamine-6-phosphate deaminase [Sporolactobacillus vineae]